MNFAFCHKKRLAIIALAAILLIVSGFLVYRFYIKARETSDEMMPFLDVDGKYADSLLKAFTPEQKLKQLLMPSAKNFKGAEGGIAPEQDSLYKLLSYPETNEITPIPLFKGVFEPDPVIELALGISSRQLLSNRNDSLIFQYFDFQIETARCAKLNMVMYPADFGNTTINSNEGTKLPARDRSLIAYFIKKGLEARVVPIIYGQSFVDVASEDKRANKNKKGNITGLNQLIGKMVPAILLDSIPVRFSGSGSLSLFLLEKYDFRGVIIINGENMSKEGAADAITSGVDIIVSQNFNADFSSEIGIKALDRAAKKVLLFKEWLIHFDKPTFADESKCVVSRAKARKLQYQLKQGSIVRLKDQNNLIPLYPSANQTVNLYIEQSSSFSKLREYFETTYKVRLHRYTSIEEVKINNKAISIVVIESAKHLYSRNANTKWSENTIIIYADDPTFLTSLPDAAAIVLLPVVDDDFLRIVANFILGGAPCDGFLPATFNKLLKYGVGLEGYNPTRLNYTIPEDAGVDSVALTAIDSIIKEGIKNGAFPGCQIFASVKGRVILNKSYGNHTYEPKSAKVEGNHVYDLNNITSAAATTLAMMKLFETGKVSLSDKLGKFFNDHSTDATTRHTIFDLPISELLSLNAGLPPRIDIEGFYSAPGKFLSRIRSTELFSSSFIAGVATLKVGEQIFMRNQYIDTLWLRWKSTGTGSKNGDFNGESEMLFLGIAIDSITKTGMSDYLRQQIYNPLGLSTICFTPYKYFPPLRIVPSVNDISWRRQIVQGVPYNPVASLLGGVSGNAGLFSNAHDLGVLGQMLLQGGTYAGTKLFDSATVALFTGVGVGRKGNLGFSRQASSEVSSGLHLSTQTYGFRGDQGSVFWIDPENEVIFVFLSNSTFPNQENKKVQFLKVPEKVQQIIYEAIFL